MSGFGDPMRVCVVGAGPRGLSVVERLSANAGERGRGLVVHLVDPHVGTGGRVWSTEQPPSMLMNTVASQVSMFTDESVECEGPVARGPSLYEWARMLPLLEAFDHYPQPVLAEARELGPNSYPTRAFCGHYYNWVLRKLIGTAPPGVRIRTHARSAVAVDDEPGGTQIVALSDGTRLAELDAVVLALGHVDMPLEEQERQLAGFAATHGLHYQPPANPAEVDLSAIEPGENVVLRGMGLCFFDYLALLTVDRGGRFERVHGGLVYRPSGREPMIHAGSRRGMPYQARGENEKGVSGRHEPRFLTRQAIARLRGHAPRVRFDADVWPLIAAEVELVYYTTLLRDRPGAAEAFAARYPAERSALLDEFEVRQAQRWDWDRIAAPCAGRLFASPAEFHATLRENLRDDVRRARRGNVSDPVKAALDVLRDLRNEVRLVVDHSGVSGSSYRDELLAGYTPLNAYLSIGPPASRIEEMIALLDAGVLTVVG
ncbi:MAG TPA: FAD/NAD(P)-binding protein, partial [Amycolatopsis sp.]|nr:FAD/NAD(P)-binding protein [Amycolatopsis sp.]